MIEHNLLGKIVNMVISISNKIVGKRYIKETRERGHEANNSTPNIETNTAQNQHRIISHEECYPMNPEQPIKQRKIQQQDYLNREA